MGDSPSDKFACFNTLSIQTSTGDSDERPVMGFCQEKKNKPNSQKQYYNAPFPTLEKHPPTLYSINA